MTGARTYLDHNASAPLRPAARAAAISALDRLGNPSSIHAEGRAARAVIEAARSQVAALVGAHARAVVFTGGATEAINTVLRGGFSTIFLSALEHPHLAPLLDFGRLAELRSEEAIRAVLAAKAAARW